MQFGACSHILQDGLGIRFISRSDIRRKHRCRSQVHALESGLASAKSALPPRTDVVDGARIGLAALTAAPTAFIIFGGAVACYVVS